MPFALFVGTRKPLCNLHSVLCVRNRFVTMRQVVVVLFHGCFLGSSWVVWGHKMCALMSPMPQVMSLALFSVPKCGELCPLPNLWYAPPCSAAYGPMPSHLDLTKETTLEIPNGVKGKIDDSQSKHSISVIFVNTGICQSGRTAHQSHADNNLRMTFHFTRCKVEE